VFSAFPCSRAVPDTPGGAARCIYRRTSRPVLPSPDLEGLGLPDCVTGLLAGSLALRPTYSLLPGFGGDLTVPFAPPGELHVLTTVYMVSFLPLTGDAPLCTAHPDLLT
jgi:hypothetical protein